MVHIKQLAVNASKCKVMNFGLGGQQCIRLMKQKNSAKKTLCKFLGLLFDGKMTFREHIDYVVKTFNQFIGLVYKVRHLYPSKYLLLFYISYAESVIRYGVLVYGSAAKTNLKKLKKHSDESGEQFFFNEKVDSLKKTIEKHNFRSVIEMYV